MNTAAVDSAPPVVRSAASVPSFAVPGTAAMVVLVDVVVFVALAARGGWVADDLDFLVAGHENRLTVDYLAHPVNDHLMPGLRLMYWVFAHTGGLSYEVTIAVRVALIVAAGAAMYRLLVLLLGRRPVVVIYLAVYCFLPLTMPSDLSLSSAVNLLPTHIAGILLIDAAVRYAATRRFRYAAAAAAWMLVGLSFWEKSAASALTAAVVVVGFVLTGTWWRRLGGALRLWPMWGLIAAAGAAFALAWAQGRDIAAIGDRELGSVTDVAVVARTAWLDSIGPSLAGGPWRWLGDEHVYVSIADPTTVGIVVGQLVVAGLLVAGARRTGIRPTLIAWSAVILYVAFTAVLLGIARSEVFGLIPARHFHYWSDLAVTITLAVACTLTAIDPARVVDRSVRPDDARQRRVARRLPLTLPRPTPAAVVASVALGISLTVTHVSYADRWDDNPAPQYLENLHADLAARPGTSMFDAVISDAVLPPNAEYRLVSGVVAMMPDVDVAFDRGNADHIVGADGHVIPAILAGVAGLQTDASDCRILVRGTERRALQLTERLDEGWWYIRIHYLANPDADMRVGVATGSGPAIQLGTETWPAGLATAMITTPPGTAFDRVVLSGADDDVSVCIGGVTVGFPIAEGDT